MKKDIKYILAALIVALLCGVGLAVMVAVIVCVLGACTKVIGTAGTVVCLMCGVLIVGMGLALIGGDGDE